LATSSGTKLTRQGTKRYLAKRDGVGGHPCIVIYEDDQPILSVYRGVQNQNNEFKPFVGGRNISLRREIADLLLTLWSMNVSWEDTIKAISVFLEMKE